MITLAYSAKPLVTQFFSRTDSDPLFRRSACSVCSKPELRQCMTLCNKSVRLGRVDKCEATEIEVVYHLQGKIGWSTVCVNGKQNSRKGNSVCETS